MPQKATLNLCGKPSIQYLIENLKKTKIADKIVLCTTLESDDDVLCSIAKDSGIEFFRGSSEDKLARWLGACKTYNIDFFVNVDGDDLFFDVPLADLCLEQSDDIDFIDGRGLYNDVYGIHTLALETVCKMKSDEDTEFIRPHFTDPMKGFRTKKIKNIPDKYKKKNIRMTMDYIEDFYFFESVIRHFKNLNTEPTFDKILKYLDQRPEIAEINWFREKEWKENQTKMISRVVL